MEELSKYRDPLHDPYFTDIKPTIQQLLLLIVVWPYNLNKQENMLKKLKRFGL